MHPPMGALMEKVEQWWQSLQKDTCVLVLGLDNAGKTVVLYCLHLDEAVGYTVPTLGFNVESVKVGNVTINMWDLGGQTAYRSLWPHYYAQSDGVVFVIDANDRDRFATVKEELHALVSHKELTGKPLLVLANKQDLPNAAGRDELLDILELDKITWSPWHIVPCTATKNQRVKIGFEWLVKELNA